MMLFDNRYNMFSKDFDDDYTNKAEKETRRLASINKELLSIISSIVINNNGVCFVSERDIFANKNTKLTFTKDEENRRLKITLQNKDTHA